MAKGRELIAEIDATQLGPGAIAFWWLGQLGYVTKLGGTVVYLDPYLSPSPRRLVAPLLAPEDVSNAAYVLCSHDHTDHVDPFALHGIATASPGALFLCSHAAALHLRAIGIPDERVIGLDEGMAYHAADIDVTPLAAAHEFLDRQPRMGHPYLSFVITANGASLYHSGDTCVYDGMVAKLKRFALDVAIVPINGRDAERLSRGCIGNMTYQEAVDLVGVLRPRLAVPGHYDMFEGNLGDPGLFAAYLRAKYPEQRYWVGPHGQRVTLDPR